jgi:hypothetical protein
MSELTRRGFLASSMAPAAMAQLPGERPPAMPAGVEVLNPRERVPLSWIIDDSTCLVNLNRFAIPQFASAFPGGGSYKHDWRSMPHEIPDSFVRRFAEWSQREGVKGKYSIVPFPALVGRVDRELPGWTPQELAASLELVHKEITPLWDIHPEMITHTRILDLKTGYAVEQRGREWMENWDWCKGRSVDEIAGYAAYALQMLKNVGFVCEGFTTPGGFGAGALPELSQAAFQAVRHVYNTELPHYFRNLFDRGTEPVTPRVEYVSGLSGGDPRAVVSIYACTGDWTGGWDCSREPEVDRFITADLSKGRMVDVITRGEPAILLCHWTGIYFNGRELGFQAMQEVVRRLHARFKNVRWMTLSEIGRYWAAKELTAIEAEPGVVRLRAPYACPDFTVRWRMGAGGQPSVGVPLREVGAAGALEPGTWRRDGEAVVVCFALRKGLNEIRRAA